MLGYILGGAAVVTTGVLAYKQLTTSRPVRKYLVALDCEPDDELALGVLRARGMRCETLMVGEGSVSSKMRRAHTYSEALGLGASIIPGLPSKKLFPGESATADVDEGHVVAFSVDTFLSSLEAMGDEATLVCLKPPREILAALEQQPARARAVFANTVLAIYGSFNVRTLGYSVTIPLVCEDTTPFKRVYYYESHGNGVPNLNPTTAPRLPRWLSRRWPRFAESMRHTCSVWDLHIILDCNQSCVEEEAKPDHPTPRWARKDKCRTAVRANFGKQFVPADPVLALLLDNPEFPPQPMSIKHSGANDEYPVITAGRSDTNAAASHKTFTWKGVSGDAVIGALNELLD
jgi:hypothetical protein